MENLKQILETGYKFRVTFRKEVIEGPFKGNKYDCQSIRFTSWHDANSFSVKCDGETVFTSCVDQSKHICRNPILEAI